MAVLLLEVRAMEFTSSFCETILSRLFLRHVKVVRLFCIFFFKGTLSRDSGVPRSPFGTLRQSPNYSFNANGTTSPGSAHSISFDGTIEPTLANSPRITAQEAFTKLYKPRNLAEKARINAGWVFITCQYFYCGCDLRLICCTMYMFFCGNI